MHEFQDFIQSTCLTDAGFIGNPYTWCNNRRSVARIWQRLDRALIYISFQNCFPKVKITHFSWVGSDHTPIFFHYQDIGAPRKSRFVFQRIRMDHPEFMQVMSQAWSKSFSGNPGTRFTKKLNHLRKVLKNWNWTGFGNLKERMVQHQTRVLELETRLQEGWSEEIHHEWENSKKQLQQLEAWENERLCSQQRMDWMKDGDKNSSFFHMVIKEKRRQNVTQIALSDGESTADAKIIGEHAEQFFRELFSSGEYYMEDTLFGVIQPAILQAENEMFCSILSISEVWQVIQQLNPDSAPGNDGFTGHFYRACWDTIKTDVYEVVVDFFRGGYLPRTITDTSIVLIPKVQDASSISEYMPISLCNFSRKIVSKILANILSVLLPKLVTQEQAGFISGRNIAPHIVMAQELIRDINRKTT